MSLVKSFRILSLGTALAAGSLPAFADLAGPNLSLGVVSPWAVLTQTSSSINSPANFTQTIDFSLASASVLRFDVRTVEYTNTRVSFYNVNFLSASFNVFDAAHQLVGSSVVDGGFAQLSCGGGYGASTSCQNNFGLTFVSSGALQAGKYTVELTGLVEGSTVPELKYGALVAAANLNAYLAAVTPTNAVPEPSSVLLMGLGLAGLGFAVRSARGRRAQA